MTDKARKTISIKVRPDVYAAFKQAVRVYGDTVCAAVESLMIAYTAVTRIKPTDTGGLPTRIVQPNITIHQHYGGPPRSPKKYAPTQQTLPMPPEPAPERPSQRCYVCGSQPAVVLGSYVDVRGRQLERPLCASCQKAAEGSGKWEGFRPL